MNTPDMNTRIPPRQAKISGRYRHGISSAVFIIITLICVSIVFGLCLLLVSSVIGGSEEKVESTERRLVYATNPELLMEACRQIAQSVGSQAVSYPDPSLPEWPPIIRKVKPKSITVDRGRVTLECGTNVYRFGLVVDTQTATNPTTMSATHATTRPAPPMATRQIAQGIWYYAEDHAIPGP
jgi:hypothetical protein